MLASSGDAEQGVRFLAAPDQGLEDGDCTELRDTVLFVGWDCQSCGHEVRFDVPKLLPEIAPVAGAHERVCQMLPKDC